jgi:hypothetical protein
MVINFAEAVAHRQGSVNLNPKVCSMTAETGENNPLPECCIFASRDRVWGGSQEQYRGVAFEVSWLDLGDQLRSLLLLAGLVLSQPADLSGSILPFEEKGEGCEHIFI